MVSVAYFTGTPTGAKMFDRLARDLVEAAQDHRALDAVLAWLRIGDRQRTLRRCEIDCGAALRECNRSYRRESATREKKTVSRHFAPEFP